MRFLSGYIVIQDVFSMKVEKLGLRKTFCGINHWKVNSRSGPLLFVGQAY